MPIQEPVRLPDAILPDQVLSIPIWCELNGFSMSTGWRVLRSGEGPPVVQLTERRVGIRMKDNIAWQESRVRPLGFKGPVPNPFGRAGKPKPSAPDAADSTDCPSCVDTTSTRVA